LSQTRQRTEYNARRRLERAWHCTCCRAVFSGHEARSRGRDHEELTGHRLVKGAPAKKGLAPIGSC